jgi:hypothetical protein
MNGISKSGMVLALLETTRFATIIAIHSKKIKQTQLDKHDQVSTIKQSKYGRM